ncbi:hypothetical protein E2562_027988 [Oryza meyeriana var. granulata]|uniref:Uncharacterized protein n=1 Tax=Oryza meyeriana var. granulata TaxID=110450 RepID=A0A6G1CU16_9ORYZ|nr:hypothetical protein E2562_027988 [Oryza meyeriana var. granulata]
MRPPSLLDSPARRRSSEPSLTTASTSQNPTCRRLLPAVTTVRSTSGRIRTDSILSAGTTLLMCEGLSNSSVPASKPSSRTLASAAGGEAASRMAEAREEESRVLRGVGAGAKVEGSGGGRPWLRKERQMGPAGAAGLARGYFLGRGAR